jgi:osomolarity two-component system response regulator SKN7
MLVDMSSSMQSGGGSTSSADFVRKLYSMLEDPANRSTVRWGNDGDTFVVLDNEAFTRTILPKHFKHSNFSSFVRQLNKYDFHKVKRPEDGSQSPYGPNASEFKHSEFRANRKDNLDSIRRKNPAPKKSMIADEQMTTANSINILNELATTTQQQVQQLQDKIREMTQSQRLMLGEIANLHKVINAQKQSQHELLNYLSFSRRESRSSTAAPSAGNSNPTAASSSDGLDELPQELRQARELLTIADRELERSGAVYASPMESPSGIFTQPSTSANMGISSDPMTDITRYPIYPVGQTVGIDPFHSDHINNIPYQLPSNQTMSYSAAPAEPALSAPTSAQQGSSTSVWGRQKPKVLLVEDDQTCSRIGAKFLTTMDCTVEVAVS